MSASHHDPPRPAPPSPVAPLAPLDFLQSHRRGSITDPSLHAAPSPDNIPADHSPLPSDSAAQLRRLLRSPSVDTQPSDSSEKHHRQKGLFIPVSLAFILHIFLSQAQTMLIGANTMPQIVVTTSSSTTTCADIPLPQAKKSIRVQSARCLQIAMALLQLAKILIPSSSVPACQVAWKLTQMNLHLSDAALQLTPEAWHSSVSMNATRHGGLMEGVNFLALRR